MILKLGFNATSLTLPCGIRIKIITFYKANSSSGDELATI